MIAIVLIGLAAGCASALMFASTMSGVPISLLLSHLAPLPLMVAALGWGPLERNDRRHRCRFRFRHLFRPALLHRLRDRSGAAGLVAWPSRAAGTAAGQYGLRQWLGAGCASPRMVSARPYPALDRWLCRAVLGHVAGVRQGRRRHHRSRCEARCCRLFLRVERHIGRRNRTAGRRDDDDLAGSVGDVCRDDDYAQPLACCKNIRDIGDAAPPLARRDGHGIAADDAGRTIRRIGILLRRRNSRGAGADRRRRADDGLRSRRPCRSSHDNDGLEEPAGLADLRLCDADTAAMGHPVDRTRSCGHRLWNSAALSARQAPCPCPRPET